MKRKSIYNKYLKFDPYPYQEVGIDFGVKRNYCIIADEPGLGKTIQAIGIACLTMRERVLIVAPAFLRYNWEEEIDKFVKDRKFEYRIISYAKIKDSEDDFKWADCVIADEVHYLKNKDAKRTQAFHQFMYDHRPARFIGLSGTPITGKIPDWYSLLMLCSYNPFRNNGIGIDNISYWDFCAKFCNVRVKKIRGRPIREYYGHKNIPGLRKILKGKYLRRLCKDVLSLGEILEQQVPIHKDDLCPDSISDMDEAKKEGIWIKIKKSSAISKANPASDFINNLCDNGPVVVFSDHRDPVDIIYNSLKSNKRRVRYINGDISMEERHTINKLFQSGRLDAVICTIAAASVGINLTKASQIVFNDLSANPAQNAQAIKRVHRIGQDEVVKAYFLTSNKIDSEITSILRQKIRTMKEAM